LAGSERQKTTAASGSQLAEGAKINQSLSALGKVITALSSSIKTTHVPFRDSVLTWLLSSNFSGSSKVFIYGFM
jgi:hypothetical protein